MDKKLPKPPRTTGFEAKRSESLEKLVLSITVRLDALAGLLVEKGVLSQEGFADILTTMQAEYRPRKLKGD